MKLYSISNLIAKSSIIIICALLISCGKDDAGPSYSFNDQNLQGTIDGETYIFGEGTVDVFSDDEGDRFSIDLFHEDEEFEDACTAFGFGDFVQVFFSIQAEVGIYELSFDLNSFSGQTVTLFNPDNTLNIIATEGAVEILSITESTVRGRIDARAESGTEVNGNFSAVFCE